MAAARSIEVPPTEAAAVATTQAEALELLFHARVPGSEHVPVYVITMRGRFRALRAGPSGKPPEGTVITATFNARTLRLLDAKISDKDDRALLPQLGPVSILAIG